MFAWWSTGKYGEDAIRLGTFNSLVPGRCGGNFKRIIFSHIIWYSNLGAEELLPPRWIPQNLTSEKSTLVQVMAPCLVPPGNKPLPEPILTQIWHHIVSLGQNELTQWYLVNAYVELEIDMGTFLLIFPPVECPGSLHHQSISSLNTDYEKWGCSCLHLQWILTTFVMFQYQEMI